MLEFDIGQLELKKLIDATQFSMASQDVRYYLNGMLFESEGHGLRTVATDGHRLATCRREVVTESLPDHQVILPRKGVLELVRLLEAEDKPVRLQIYRSNLRAALDGFIFTSKLVDGRFPDWRRVIPRNSDKALIAGREDLRQAFARAAILSNEKFRGCVSICRKTCCASPPTTRNRKKPKSCLTYNTKPARWRLVSTSLMCWTC